MTLEAQILLISWQLNGVQVKKSKVKVKAFVRWYVRFVLMVVWTAGQAQVHCLTNTMDSVRRSQYPSSGTTKSFERWMTETKGRKGSRPTTGTTIYRIPVVVHVVHNGEPVGTGANLSHDQVLSQIDVLNEDFRRAFGTNGFNTHADGADTHIEFFLAPQDPMGNLLPEPGIDRIHGGQEEWTHGLLQSEVESELKPSTIWDTDRYCNIWTLNFGGPIGRFLLGYAQFPDASDLQGLEEEEGSAHTDGIVIDYKYFGSREKGDFQSLVAPYDHGRSTTHEMGDWLGLRHIWGDGDCAMDDYVIDTPPAAESFAGCPQGAYSCEEESMIQNYMDYTDDLCKSIFTEGQKERMLTVLEHSPRRANMVRLAYATADSPTSISSAIFPNPVSEQLYLRLEGITGSLTVTILSTSGELSKVEEREIAAQRYLWRINMEDLKTGIYALKVTSAESDHLAVHKFFVR